MSKGFGLGAGWLKAGGISTSVYCMGAVAGITVYYLAADWWISWRRQAAIVKRSAVETESEKEQQEEEEYDSSGNRYGSLRICGRFVNPFDSWRDKTLWDFVRWLATRTAGNGLPSDKTQLEKELPLARPYLRLLRRLAGEESDTETETETDAEYADYPTIDSIDGDSMMTATWIGQSTCFVQMEGLSILTDPIFKRRTVFSWLGPERLRPVPCQLADLPRPDIVLVSHNHFDHLDVDVVRALGNTVTWYVPLGLRAWFARLGVYRVRELDWWQETEYTARSGRVFRIVATPTQHWSGRTGLDSNESLWCSFLVRGVRASAFHCGDTGYCAAFERIGRLYGSVSLAILPIGSYAPRWYMQHQHIDPDDAVRIHRDLRAQRSIGVHWGTFMMSDEHYLAPPRDLAAAAARSGLAGDEFVAPQLGRTNLYAV
ncbi:hypothetical protein IWW48_000901 [Coemansia sp. RSA 1200]|nr:hypothetical protein IWW48_000901 [Coemansia sp. RSA 1200]